MDVIKITKLFSHIHNTKIDVEFTDDEIDSFNSYIKDGDVSSIVHLFESKEVICAEVLKDMIHSKVDSFWQFIMDQSYKKWDDDNSMSREEFLNQLTDYEKIAVMFGNFNYQVENGGLSQWDDNGYSKDLEELYQFLKKSNFDEKIEFLCILDNFSDIKSAIEKLDRYDDWYDEDCQTRMKTLNIYDSNYYRIQKSWDEYFENYLIVNIPDEYKQKIIDLKEDINI